MNPTDRHQITDLAGARAWLAALHNAGMMFHPDDCAADCLDGHGLTAEQLRNIDANMADVHRVDLAPYECPSDLALDIAQWAPGETFDDQARHTLAVAEMIIESRPATMLRDSQGNMLGHPVTLHYPPRQPARKQSTERGVINHDQTA